MYITLQRPSHFPPTPRFHHEPESRDSIAHFPIKRILNGMSGWVVETVVRETCLVLGTWTKWRSPCILGERTLYSRSLVCRRPSTISLAPRRRSVWTAGSLDRHYLSRCMVSSLKVRASFLCCRHRSLNTWGLRSAHSTEPVNALRSFDRSFVLAPAADDSR